MRSIAIAFIVLAAACGGERPRQRIDLLLLGGYVIDPLEDSRDGPQDIGIANGRIVAVGSALDGAYTASTTIDITGEFVIPGLADMHSHFGNGILSPEEDDTSQVLARHLYYGNTTILNLGSFQAWPERIDDLRSRMASGQLQGPRLLAAGSLITRVGSHPTTTIYPLPVQQRIADIVAAAPAAGPIDLTPLRATTLVRTPADVAAEVARVTEWGADVVKITVESGPKEFGPKPRMTAEMIVAAVTEADAPVLCHVSALPELEDCIAAGASAAVHGITPDTPLPEDLERRMVEAGFALIPTAAMFDGWVRYPADLSLLDDPWLSETISASESAWLSSDETVQRMAWTDTRPVRELGRHLRRFHDAGGLLVAGTDTGNPYRFAGYALHEELAFYVASGLSEREALATATINAATFMGAEDEWGSIREGLAADLVVLAANPLAAIENTRSVVHVIRAGRIVERARLPVR